MDSANTHTAPADDAAKGPRFADARAAGRRLAARLAGCSGLQGALVLGVARGGVPVAFEAARALDLPLDLVLLRRLLAPRGPLDPACAVSVGGSLFLDEELTTETGDGARAAFVAEALAEFAARALACRGTRPPAALKGRRVVLVDNGIRTGSTLRAALRALRSFEPARVVAAVPVAAPEAYASLEPLADELVCLAWPRPFGHVGLWYADFRRPGDEEIREMLETADVRS